MLEPTPGPDLAPRYFVVTASGLERSWAAPTGPMAGIMWVGTQETFDCYLQPAGAGERVEPSIGMTVGGGGELFVYDKRNGEPLLAYGPGHWLHVEFPGLTDRRHDDSTIPPHLNREPRSWRWRRAGSTSV